MRKRIKCVKCGAKLIGNQSKYCHKCAPHKDKVKDTNIYYEYWADRLQGLELTYKDGVGWYWKYKGLSNGPFKSSYEAKRDVFDAFF